MEFGRQHDRPIHQHQQRYARRRSALRRQRSRRHRQRHVDRPGRRRRRRPWRRDRTRLRIDLLDRLRLDEDHHGRFR
ncbi:MAG: hypothetical protein AMS14_11215 [Planctomycetes bacterium DG_20]|nr:MAG: hypothetical protein AMS14_11215 [Planctomycetes bacterium DG_20]